MEKDAKGDRFEEVRADFRRITETLIRKGKTVTTMESCTAGLIASLITDTEGSSACLRGAFVTYSNEMKVRCGVSPEVIRTFSVYSKETACAMAEAAKEALGADIAVGVTGTFGNTDPENAAASVPGELFYAIASASGTEAKAVKLLPVPSRYAYKMEAAAIIAKDLLCAAEAL